MASKRADSIGYFFRDQDACCYDEASEGETDNEEVEEHVSEVEDAEEDLDFDPPTHKSYSVDSSEPEASTSNSRRTGRPRSFIHGKNKFKWSVKVPEQRGRRSLSDVYMATAKGTAKNVTTPLEAWSLLFTDDMLEMVVQHTNEEIGRKLANSENIASFQKNTELDELKAFIGLLYFGGLQRWNHLHLNELWSAQFGNKLYRSVMSQRRFEFLLGALRFDNKNTRRQRVAEHKLAPIKELWDAFIDNCQKYYSPSTNCTIDEQLLSFRGRFHARMYIPSKPDKYGIKIVMCNDVQTSYMLSAEPYVGKVETDKPVPTYYVLKLSQPIHGTQRNITCDNWFTSIPLVREMEQYSLTLVGTLRKNKPEIPPSFIRCASAMTSRFAYAQDMILVSYCPKKNKVVLLISTKHKKGKIDEESGKPEIVLFYNKTKGGTDRYDQLCKHFTTARITNRWPMRIFYGILDQGGINSSILYYLREENNVLTRRDFLKSLIFDLVKPFLRRRLIAPTLRITVRQSIQEILDDQQSNSSSSTFTPNTKLLKRKRCSVCPSSANSKTWFCCVLCKAAICESHRTTLCLMCFEQRLH